ncbi:MAG: DNA-methyltransferase, partial [Pyrinomonadaceae bacterium]
MLDRLPAGAADMCITSPPYWAQRRYADDSGLGQEATPEYYVENLCAILNRLGRVLVPGGSLWLNIGDTYQKKRLMGVPWRVALDLQDSGWILRNAIVWDKMKGNPCNAKDKLRNVHEMVFHLVRRQDYYYDVDSIRNEPGKPFYRNGRIVTATGVSGSKYEQQIDESTELTSAQKQEARAALRAALRAVEMGELPDFRMVIRGTQRSTHSDNSEYSGRAAELQRTGFAILPYHKHGTKPGDVWRIIPEDEWRTDTHYAVFPEELCRLPIRATAPPGGVVLDPFAGTGTALVVALKEGRSAIGIDTSLSYLEHAADRIRQAKMGSPEIAANGGERPFRNVR